MTLAEYLALPALLLVLLVAVTSDANEAADSTDLFAIAYDNCLVYADDEDTRDLRDCIDRIMQDIDPIGWDLQDAGYDDD
jgi:hypothetical protein